MSSKGKAPAAPARVRSTKANEQTSQPEPTGEADPDAQEVGQDEANSDENLADNDDDGTEVDTNEGETGQDGRETPPPAGEPEPAATGAPPAKAPATGAPKPAAQAGFAKRAGRESTAPVKQVGTKRPYLDSPRAFGIHIDGLLVRFGKGRTTLTAEQAKALKADSYTKDNGAEVIE